MKIILRADVENLGRLGDVVTVKAGYGRNYLLPQGLAIAGYAYFQGGGVFARHVLHFELPDQRANGRNSE